MSRRMTLEEALEELEEWKLRFAALVSCLPLSLLETIPGGENAYELANSVLDAVASDAYAAGYEDARRDLRAEPTVAH